jgi:uncharacterized protein YjiS (DUF1127 family)
MRSFDMPATFASTNRVAQSGERGFASAWNALVQRVERALAERRQVRQLAHELQMCSDRELGDMGLSRCDIPAVVNGTYTRD